MESVVTHESDLNLEATELRLGLPGREKEPVNDLSLGLRLNKRASHQMLSSTEESRVNINSNSTASDASNGGGCRSREASPPSKAQVVGWPPIRSYRKNNLQVKKSDVEGVVVMFVKVSMDGVPYLRKIDLKAYKTYSELLKGLEELFKFTIGEYSEREGYNGSEYVPTYEDKDGDWMLVGDVPWAMFISTCKRLRIMKGAEAKGLCCI